MRFESWDYSAEGIVESSGLVQTTVLVVERCQFVSDYDEFLARFSRYASQPECIEVCNVIAPNIRKDYSLMDEYFPPK